MRKGEIIRNWILVLIVISLIGFLFGHFLGWQWGLAISLGVSFGLIILLGLTIAGINELSSFVRIGTDKGYLIQKKK